MTGPRTAASRTTGEAGMTVIELMVAMFIFSIVTAVLFSFMQSLTSATARAERNVRAEQDAQLALRQMTAEIRAANPIRPSTSTCAYADCLTFDIQRPTTFAGSCQSRRVTYRLNRTTNLITRDQTDNTFNSSTGTCSSTVTSTNRTILSSVAYPASTPLFRYSDKSGNVLNPASAGDSARIPQVSSAGGTASVEITLVIRYQARGAPDLTLTSHAVLRNNR